MMRRLPRKGEKSPGATQKYSHVSRPQSSVQELSEESLSIFRELIARNDTETLMARVRKSRNAMHYMAMLLSDVEDVVRYRAAEVLAEMAIKRADMTPVLPALERAISDPVTKKGAVRAIVFHSKRVVDIKALRRFLESDDPEIRDEAVAAVS